MQLVPLCLLVFALLVTRASADCDNNPECERQERGCDEFCMCSEPGYGPDPISSKCIDVNGCEIWGTDSEACGNSDHVTCHDEGLNVRRCECDTGYESSSAGVMEDEENDFSPCTEILYTCDRGISACNSVLNALCTPTEGDTRTCSCEPGFAGIAPVTGLANNQEATAFSGQCLDVKKCLEDGACGNVQNIECKEPNANHRRCVCAPGFTGIDVMLEDDQPFTESGSCINTNACADLMACGNVANSVCEDLGVNNRTCYCKEGYTGIEQAFFADDDGGFSGECTRIPPCDLFEGRGGPCNSIPNTKCTNLSEETRLCSCADGYSGADPKEFNNTLNNFSGTCSLTDACEDPLAACGNVANSECIDLGINNRSCSCKEGFTGPDLAYYEDHENGFSGTCTESNPCLLFDEPCNGILNAVCTPLAWNSRRCSCAIGYSGSSTILNNELNNYDATCTDINACSTVGCGVPHTVCKDNGPDSRTCSCEAGYSGPEPKTFNDTEPGFTEPCLDYDRCEDWTEACNGDPNAICEDDGPNLRTCSCPFGYIENTQTFEDEENDFSGCEDIDGCELFGSTPFAACGGVVNTVCQDDGSDRRVCSCAPGTVGEIVPLTDRENYFIGSCQDKPGCSLWGNGLYDACGGVKNTVCEADADVNSRTCRCAAGYEGPEKSLTDTENDYTGECVDVDGCKLYKNPCGGVENSICTNGDAHLTRTCSCAPGFTGAPAVNIPDSKNTWSANCREISITETMCSLYGCEGGICANVGENQRKCTCDGSYIVGGPFTDGILLDDAAAFSGCTDVNDDPTELAKHVEQNTANIRIFLRRTFPRISDIFVTISEDSVVTITFTLPGASRDSILTGATSIGEAWDASVDVVSLGNDQFHIELSMGDLGSSSFLAPSLLSLVVLFAQSW
eukprot:TRINITY_DN11683_c0_g1_i1.p1 TRINITY_DN11683_c0_g1~~TRINITY_DN11683_c0_g1_i1.p1  ORF type:complete len:908 (-),score=171.34 TRINITY_DN11683_c0_g1_i1:92-2815(-)